MNDGDGGANPLTNPWASDRGTLELYRRRCRREAEEMTCARQAAEVLAPLAASGESMLDAGCGGGYYYWSFAERGPELDWHGLDFTPEMIELARDELCPRAGLEPSRFRLGAIEDLGEERYDNVLCFNVLTNCPHYGLPLERLLAVTERRILLRESLGDSLEVRFTPDRYLDPDKRHIRVYHNTYPLAEVTDFMRDHGFEVTGIVDERTGDGTEMVVDIPHRWRILLGERSPRSAAV
jgi:SAM-dependent methyltransferase